MEPNSFQPNKCRNCLHNHETKLEEDFNPRTSSYRKRNAIHPGSTSSQEIFALKKELPRPPSATKQPPTPTKQPPIPVRRLPSTPDSPSDPKKKSEKKKPSKISNLYVLLYYFNNLLHSF